MIENKNNSIDPQNLRHCFGFDVLGLDNNILSGGRGFKDIRLLRFARTASHGVKKERIGLKRIQITVGRTVEPTNELLF